MSETIIVQMKADPYHLMDIMTNIAMEKRQERAKKKAFDEYGDINDVDSALMYYKIMQQWDFVVGPEEKIDYHKLADKFFVDKANEDGDVDLTIELLNEFAKYAMDYLDEISPCGAWEWKMVSKHGGLSGVYDNETNKFYPCKFGGHANAIAEVFGVKSPWNIARMINDGEMTTKQMNDRISKLDIYGTYLSEDITKYKSVKEVESWIDKQNERENNK